MEFLSGGVEATIDFAERLGAELKGGEVITLSGELGAGKTHFAKGIAKGLGITDTVISPTFVLMRFYTGTRLNLCHCDMYRIEDENELYETDFFEVLKGKNTVTVIEWAENIKNLLPRDVIKILIEYNGETSRKITVKK